MLCDANRFLFTDTNALTTYIFSLYYHGKADSRLKELALNAAYRYDMIFLCEDDIIYDNTWDRSGETHRHTFQKQIVAPFFRLFGTLEKRTEKVSVVLEKVTKYGNLVDLLVGWSPNFSLDGLLGGKKRCKYGLMLMHAPTL